LVVDGEPNATDLPGRESEECFCPALRFATDADGRTTNERTEPIAADARPGKDGKPNAKLKLIAGMLDVGFDALKQREQRRQVQRMTAIAGLALVVMAVTIVLAIAALVSRHRAVIAQHEAVVAKQAAVRRQKQAEGLVGFMLGDLNDKLQEVNRLDIMQSVDDKAMAYFKSLPNIDVNDATLAQRAKTLEKIGSVRMQQGRLPGALAAYQASAQISSQLAAAKPVDVARQVAYSRTLAFIGIVYWNQSNLVAAQQAFETGRRALRGSQTQAKDNPSLLYQLQNLDSNIGNVLEARAQLSQAETEYQNTLAVSRELVQLKPDNSDYVSQLGDAYNNLGKLALERGDLASAIAQYRADNVIETRLSARDPKNNGLREALVLIRAILGRTLVLTGNVQDGMSDLQQAVNLAAGLVKVDPNDTDFRDDLGLYSTQLARLLRLNGDTNAAEALTSRAVAILAGLTRKDPSNQGWQSDYAAALTEQAAQSRATGDIAASQAQSALRILEPMLAKSPDDRSTLLATIGAKLLLAESSADAATARSLQEAAMQTMQAQKTGKDDPRLLALQIETLLALDRKDEAQPLIKRLWNEGYREPALVALLQRAHITYPTNTTFQARLLAATRVDGEAASDAGKDVHRP
ncbi:MAG TPA: hypothetical protein VJN66_00585, partial [Rhodanobacteraceae bacterium]|nr:hypothetical protein [Rhodanobacteraceae bacterium]